MSRELFRGFVGPFKTVYGLLCAYPGHQLADPVLESVARLVADQLANARDVGKAMPNVARPELARDLEVATPAELLSQQFRDPQDAGWPAGADVEHLVVGRRVGHRQATRLDNVADVDEVTLLQAVLVDQ